MTRFNFYRQQRYDGGIRTGIDVDDAGELQAFVPGTDEEDPTLAWYVDLRGEIRSVEPDVEAVREWLLRHGDLIGNALRDFAGEIAAGLDVPAWPVVRDLPVAIPDSNVAVAVSASRRTDARQLAARVADVAEHWREYVASVQPTAEVA